MKRFLSLFLFIFLIGFVSAYSHCAGDWCCDDAGYVVCNPSSPGVCGKDSAWCDNYNNPSLSCMYNDPSWCCHSGGYVIDYTSKMCCPPNYPFHHSASNGCYLYPYGTVANPTSSDNYYTRLSDCDWYEWSPYTDECIGNDYYKCSKGGEFISILKNQGKILNKCGVECLSDSNCPANEKVSETCSGNDLIYNIKDYSCSDYKCTSKSIQQNKGKILNKCKVECLSDSNCLSDSYIETKYCKDNNVVQKFRDYSCKLPVERILHTFAVTGTIEDYQCGFTDEEKSLEECDWKCGEGKCIVHICDEDAKKCVGDDLMICQNNEFNLQEVCERGCEEGKCVVSFFEKYKFYILLIGGLTLLISFLLFKRKR